MQYPCKLQKTHILANSAEKNAIAEIVGSSLFHKMQQHKSLFLNTLDVSHLVSIFWRRKSMSGLCKAKKKWTLPGSSEKIGVAPTDRKEFEMPAKPLFMNILLASRLFPRFWLDHNRSQASNPNGMNILRFTAKKIGEIYEQELQPWH